MLNRYAIRVTLLSLLVSSLTFAETIRVSGSNTVGAKLLPQCAKGFLQQRGSEQVTIATTGENEFLVNAPDSTLAFAVRAHGSSTGFKDLLADQADIAMSSRPIKNSEQQALASRGDMRSLQGEHIIAMDGLAILIHPSNPVSHLTTEQIALIFSGQISNWSELGGPDLSINLYARDNNSGTYDTFKGLVLQKRYQLADQALRFESNDELSDRVANDPAGIGFSGLASVRAAKAIAVANQGTAPIAPSHLSIATEDYPLSRRLFVYTPPQQLTPLLREFIDFCQSKPGQDIVAEVGFISQNIIAVEQTAPRNAPQQYAALPDFARRLSVNFRFQPGSSLLDNKSMKDLERLLDYVRTDDQRSKSIYLVGFSDKGKAGKRAEILSRYRTLTVWGQLMHEKVRVEEAITVGAFLPVASGDGDATAFKNSRVEVWIANNS